MSPELGRADGTAPVLVELRAVTKRFGRHPALQNLDLRVSAGERLAVFGANGAGKTTLLRIVATLLHPNSGSVQVGRFDALRQRQEVRRLIGVVGHQTYLYDELTPVENLRFYGAMYGVPDLETRIDEVLELVSLGRRRHDRVRLLSRGLQQRAAIARAVLHRPPLLLLDEPDTGLDQGGLEVLTRLLESGASQGGAALLASHDLELGLGASDRVIVLDSGRVALEAEARQLEPRDIRQQFYGIHLEAPVWR